MLKSIQGILPKIKYDNASIIEGGYFYSFEYRFDKNPNNHNINTNGWDSEPIIISMGAIKTNPNFIIGVNLHFVDKVNDFLAILNTFGGAMEKDGLNKIILTKEIIERIYRPALKGIRIYNKKYINGCYRINNSFVKDVLNYQIGSFYMSSSKHNQYENDFKRSIN